MKNWVVAIVPPPLEPVFYIYHHYRQIEHTTIFCSSKKLIIHSKQSYWSFLTLNKSQKILTLSLSDGGRVVGGHQAAIIFVEHVSICGGSFLGDPVNIALNRKHRTWKFWWVSWRGETARRRRERVRRERNTKERNLGAWNFVWRRALQDVKPNPKSRDVQLRRTRRS